MDDTFNDLLYWLDRCGNFDSTCSPGEYETELSQRHPDLFDAYMAKRKAERMFRLELKEARGY